MTRFPRALALATISCLFATLPAGANNVLTNGGFENGDLSGGWSIASAFRVEVLEAADIVPPIAPAEGTFFTLLANGPANVGGPTGFFDGNVFRDFNRSELRIDFTVVTDSELSFQWMFLTSEVGQLTIFDDFFFVVLTNLTTSTSTTILGRSIHFPGGVSTFPDSPPYDGIPYRVQSGGLTNNNFFPAGRTGWNPFSQALTPGSYRLQFFIADQVDRIFDSGLLLDDVRVVPTADLSITKDDGVDTAIPGQPLVYEIVVSNAGPADAEDVVVSDSFPADLTGVTWTCVATGGASCTGTSPGDGESGSGDLMETVDVPVGGTLTYTVQTTVDAGATGSLVNTATVDLVDDCLVDPDPGNNSATDIDTLSPTQTLFQVTDTAGTVLIAKGGALVFSAVSNRQVVVDRDLSLVAYVSNGNPTGGNGDTGTEVFLQEIGGGTEQITDVAEPLAFRHAGSPSLSASGEWLAFSSSADLLPPGNEDGNPEIYRYFRPAAGAPVLEQVTSTGVVTPGCENESPSIQDTGAVAFVTTCGDEIAAGFNGDGNPEPAVWTGSAFAVVETAGCFHRDPSIARGTGTRVAYVSDCNVTGLNLDANPEIVQWEWAMGPAGYDQITTTGSGVSHEVPSSSGDGGRIAFLTNGDPGGVGNPEENLEVFLFDRFGPQTFTALTDTGGTVLHTFVSLDPSGDHVAYERLDALLQDFEIFHQEIGLGVENAVAVSAGSVDGASIRPSVALSGTTPAVVLQSVEDFPGAGNDNGDGNLEVWYGLVIP